MPLGGHSAISRPAPRPMAGQKAAPQQQHQRAGEEQHAGPGRQSPARPAWLPPEQQATDEG